jgi:2-keto-4-pentenoate hydratase/2-oxohepta-3-ene-1,7-dioic acid hydratase in catechol pathway
MLGHRTRHGSGAAERRLPDDVGADRALRKRLAGRAGKADRTQRHRIVVARHHPPPHLLSGRKLSPAHDQSGLDPDAKTFNMFFTKSDASVAPPVGTVQRPAHVALLDYEIELALVFRRAIQSPVTVTREALKDYVFAAAIANDISARDVQLPQMQFFKGKSYRGFYPLGPWLTVLEPDEFAFLDDLHLQLVVKGTVRQSDTTANLVFKPWETISELSTFAQVSPGDVLLTGTPSGCALHVPPPTVRRFLQPLPERTFWQLFLTSQSRRPAYLQPGDRMTATIRSADGRLNLGQQTTTIARCRRLRRKPRRHPS